MDKKKYIQRIILLGATIGGIDFNFPQLKIQLNDIDDVVKFVTTLLDFAIGFSAVVAVVMLVYSGFLYITSSGDSERIGNATKGLTAAIVGLVIIFLARTLVVFLLEEFLL